MLVNIVVHIPMFRLVGSPGHLTKSVDLPAIPRAGDELVLPTNRNIPIDAVRYDLNTATIDVVILDPRNVLAVTTDQDVNGVTDLVMALREAGWS